MPGYEKRIGGAATVNLLQVSSTNLVASVMDDDVGGD